MKNIRDGVVGLFDYNLIIGVGSLSATIIGFLYAFYQGSEKKKLEGFVRSQNWHLYSKMNNANGQLQAAIKIYRERHGGHLEPDVLAGFEKADAWSQDVLREVIRQIQLSEKHFNSKHIDRWVGSGKINEHHANALFRTLLP